MAARIASNFLWNFSVGSHDIKFMSTHGDASGAETCPKESRGEDIVVEDNMENPSSYDDGVVGAIVPDGVLYRADSRGKQIIWKKKLSSPIVQIWEYRDKRIGKINIFEGSVLDDSDNREPHAQPAFYLGSHKGDMYLQRNWLTPFSFPTPTVGAASGPSIATGTIAVGAPSSPKVNWKPYLITAGSRTPVIQQSIERDVLPSLIDDEDSLLDHLRKTRDRGPGDDPSTALTLHYEDYPFDHGYLLYPDKGLIDPGLVIPVENLTEEVSSGNRDVENTEAPNSNDGDGAEFDEHSAWEPQIIIMGLGYWWKEVLLISVSFGILLNMAVVHPFLDRLYRYARGAGFRDGVRWSREQNDRWPAPHSSTALVPYRGPPSAVAVSSPASPLLAAPLAQFPPETPPSPWNRLQNPLHSASAPININRQSSDSTSAESDTFMSRFLTDFTPLEVLGWGGFGVVFKVQNSLDDQYYAVKRICLPNRVDAREKVMREVRVLAKLDHKHIIRFYQAWLETPPVGWQEEMDVFWKQGDFSETHFPGHSSLNVASRKRKKRRSGWRKTVSSEKGSSADDESSSRIDMRHLASGQDLDEDESSGGISFRASYSEEGSGDLELQRTEPSIDIIFEEEDGDEKDRKPVEEESGVALECSRRRLQSEGSTNPGSPQSRRRLTSDSSLLLRDDDDSTKPRPPIQKPLKVYLYIQMQLCRRETLQDWLSEHTSPEDRGVEKVQKIFKPIVSAVEYIHSQNLIHRDLKPSNIFFDLNDCVKVGDFGLVTPLKDSSASPDEIKDPSSNTASLYTDNVGTPSYMSPEQLNGSPYDESVDVYSLGLILFELLVPFKTEMERRQTLRAVRELNFPQSVEQMPETPILRRMLSRSPSERPSAKKIQAWLNDSIQQKQAYVLAYVPIGSDLGLRNHSRALVLSKKPVVPDID
ncbi:unnamed protein product [Cyprideis torosa]|uniref:non-specific serine/threonine protein kinase n=1 Tax=Cyprideis torosa TaxID=163714 RepID=A0A7R8W7F9_9CRUS|nr:unnamed protein product [Cyprideis torosa]CAG0887530.1 unnamed protein product [Cyprideis torosa]